MLKLWIDIEMDRQTDRQLILTGLSAAQKSLKHETNMQIFMSPFTKKQLSQLRRVTSMNVFLKLTSIDIISMMFSRARKLLVQGKQLQRATQKFFWKQGLILTTMVDEEHLGFSIHVTLRIFRMFKSLEATCIFIYKIKVALSGLRKFLTTESSFKMKNSALYFISKTLFVLKIFKFLSRLYGHVSK